MNRNRSSKMLATYHQAFNTPFVPVFSLSMATPLNKASSLGYSPNKCLNAYLNAVINTDGLNTFLNEIL